MRQLRGGKDLWLIGKGPACLTQALGITSAENGLDLCVRDSVCGLNRDRPFQSARSAVSPRIGLGRLQNPGYPSPGVTLSRVTRLCRSRKEKGQAKVSVAATNTSRSGVDRILKPP
jgi:hypothetical protein